MSGMQTAPPLPGAVLAGFWRRWAAFLVDGVVLGAAGWLLGWLLFDQLAALGGWGRLVGFAVMLAYFGVMDSRLCHGQSLGKRWLGIEVVGQDGDFLSPARATLRAGVVGVPWFLNGAMLPGGLLLSWFGVVLSLLVFGVGLGLGYLIVFNRRTRQSLHDLAVGSHVERVDCPWHAPWTLSMWRGHYLALAALALLAALAPLASSRLLARQPLAEMVAAQQAMEHAPAVAFAGVSYGTQYLSTPSGHTSQSYIGVRAVMTRQPDDFTRVAAELARRVLAVAPSAATRDRLAIRVVYGFDIGIASGWKEHDATHSPAEWRVLLNAAD
jgi:uncharacterized RDD family membrane protein YckC